MKRLSHYFSFISVDLFYPVFVSLFVLLSFWRDFNTDYYLLDTLEHIRASLAVSSGLLPYTDFFEHHHPLLWYISAPLAKIFYLKTIIIPIFRIIGTSAYLCSLFILYQIVRNLYNKQAAKFSVLCLISIPTLWYDISNFRPDSFMLLFFLLGLNFLLDYINTKRCKYLALSYFFVSISFLFLQKVVILILPFGIFNLYALLKKEIKLNHFIYACIIGFLPIAATLSFLFYVGIFSDFIYYNYTFNTYVQDYYEGYTSGVSSFLRFLAFVIFLFIVRTYRYSFKTNIIFLCFLFSGFSLIYFSPHGWYYISYFVFASILLGKYSYIVENNYTILGLLFIFICSIISLYPENIEKQRYKSYIENVERIVQRDMHNDIIDFSIIPINIFGSLDNFYWFGFHNVVIIDALHNPDKLFNPDVLIKNTTPKYLILESSFGTLLPLDGVLRYKAYWFVKRNAQILKKMQEYPQLRSKLISIDADFWQIDEEWIKSNYTQIEDTNIYKRNDLKE